MLWCFHLELCHCSNEILSTSSGRCLHVCLSDFVSEIASQPYNIKTHKDLQLFLFLPEVGCPPPTLCCLPTLWPVSWLVWSSRKTVSGFQSWPSLLCRIRWLWKAWMMIYLMQMVSVLYITLSQHSFWLVITVKTQAFLIRLMRVLFYSSQHEQYQDRETEAAEWN